MDIHIFQQLGSTDLSLLGCDPVSLGGYFQTFDIYHFLNIQDQGVEEGCLTLKLKP
jgi:hypothetical protein